MLKRNGLLVFIYMVVAFMVTKGAITSPGECKEQKEAFDTYITSEPVDTVWRGAGKLIHVFPCALEHRIIQHLLAGRSTFHTT